MAIAGDVMAQRVSGFERMPRELYETPAWVTSALLPYLKRERSVILDPACGSGKVVEVLNREHNALGYDIHTGTEFEWWSTSEFERLKIHGVVTNPPYGPMGKTAVMFIQRALMLTQPCKGFVAMLLPTDFDHAFSRQDLFGKCPAFACKLHLLRRIVWFEPEDGSTAHPSTNHCWFVWDYRHRGAPHVRYAA